MIRILTTAALLTLLGGGATVVAAEGGSGKEHSGEHATTAYAGILAGVSTTASTITVTISHKGSDGKAVSESKSLTVTADTTVTINGKTSALTDLVVGTEIHVKAAGDVAKHIVIGEAPKEHHKKKDKKKD